MLWPLVALVVLIVLLPTLRTVFRTRPFTVKVGSFELSAQAATDNLAKQIEDLQKQLNALVRPETDETETEHERSGATERPAPVLVRSVLWVDDKPDNNAFEIGRLQDAGVAVQTVTSTQHALELLRPSPGAYQALISDMGRREGLRFSPTAGIKAIELARQAGFQGRAVVYTTPDAARQWHDALAGLDAVATASPTELYRLLGLD